MTRVCFDLDGVLAQYYGWPKDGSIGDPLPAGVRLLELCKEAGYKTVLSTCRTHPSHGRKSAQQQTTIVNWLNEHGLWSLFDKIDTEGKPIADIYVDDRGLRFNQDKANDPLYGSTLFDTLKILMEARV